MKVTVVTLYDADTGETHVGVVQGEVNETDRRFVAQRFGATYKPQEEQDREVFFREVELADMVESLTDLYNMDDTP